MTVKRMDNVGIVVEDLDAAVEFFTEMGLILEGRTTIEGDWSGRVTGVHSHRARPTARAAGVTGERDVMQRPERNASARSAPR